MPLAPDAPLGPVRLSVVVPTLDEALRIGACLAHLRQRPGIDEIVVVDGGSTDGTRERVAREPGVALLDAPAGRGGQLAVGARHAAGDALLFLHADCRLPEGAPQRIREALARPGVVAGAFRTRHVLDAPGATWLRPALGLADLRASYTRLPYGDQALFVWAWAYRLAGGFARIPLFEDIDLARRLWRLGRGRLERLDARVEVSARRYAARPLRTAIAMNALPVLWRLGASEARLARWYGLAR